MSAEANVYETAVEPFQVRTVGPSRPLTWVRKGWDDLDRIGGASVGHGLLVTGLGLVILLLASTHPYLMAAAISGFLLVGPVMATGLCELSRRRAAGEPTTFDGSLDALPRHTPALMRFAALLVAITASWFLVSALVLEAVFRGAVPTVSEAQWGGFLEMATPLQIALYIVAGGILACLVFVVSVVAVPAIIDRHISALEAMRLSARVVIANPKAMLVWAGLIVALIAAGFGTFLLGMVLLYPLLGHATWHAYRDLVH